MRSVAWVRAGGVAQQDREASVRTPPAGGAKALTEHDRVMLTPAKDRLWDTRGNAHDGDARNILNQKKKDGAIHGYHPRCGGRYDSKEDRSPPPEPPGSRVFSREICVAPFSPTLSVAHHTHQVLGGDESRALAQQLPPGMLAGWRE